MARDEGLRGLRIHTDEGDSGAQAAIALTPTTMTPTTMTPTPAVDIGLCWIYSRAVREGLAIYDLKPQEFWLAQVLILDSYDRLDDSGAAAPVFRARLRLEVWARQGGFEDARGVRLDKLEMVLK